mmetsp:Transcript_21070/g.30104  ORF Transcript_21070/g.30104 Transcript_21070/m.30104 type:complete len:168 (+) Transcript_21070:155-658(+)|eukprot:CAMPEP_0172431526 /NCGR_PEP_ID=MMETSP1064-20121228/58774_1 /TAXON_ID=202472 /ORGANISM="Aulacoseira subarctica , Strain CCAP 1002/5" /LENGTH=167 /DNA_ID=CAMNT_0013178255 /DNA_START=134 /DNA_END=637 /DNA_ORIENTATION=+
MGFKKGLQNTLGLRTPVKGKKGPSADAKDELEKKTIEEVVDQSNVRDEPEEAHEEKSEQENIERAPTVEKVPSGPADSPAEDALKEIPPVKSNRSLLSIKSLRSKKSSEEKPPSPKESIIEAPVVELEEAPKSAEVETAQATEETTSESKSTVSKAADMCGLSLCLG